MPLSANVITAPGELLAQIEAYHAIDDDEAQQIDFLAIASATKTTTLRRLLVFSLFFFYRHVAKTSLLK